MNWTSIRPWLASVVRLALGVIWLLAGWSKVKDPATFVRAVRAYDATPEWLSKAIGYGLPVLELGIGVLLIIGLITRIMASVSALLFLVFLIGLVQAAARGIKLECGCFGGGGVSSSTHYTLDILRDLGLIVLAVYLVRWPMSRFSVDERMGASDYVPPPSAKRMRSPEGQRKYNALLEARRKEAASRTRYLTSALGFLMVLIVAISIGVQAGRAKFTGDAAAVNTTVASGVVLGKPAKATVDIFEDFQCPACLAFQQSAGADIDSMISTGHIQARFHMMAFLDASSNGNKYSTRAANAGVCAADIGVDEFLKWHDYLYGKDTSGKEIQPSEGTDGRTDADLISYARSIGITGTPLSTFTTCVQTQQHKDLVKAITDNASQRGVNSTPTIKVNGKDLSTNTKAAFDAAVTAVAGPAPTPTPSKSAAASSSASPAK